MLVEGGVILAYKKVSGRNWIILRHRCEFGQIFETHCRYLAGKAHSVRKVRVDSDGTVVPFGMWYFRQTK